MRTWTLGEDLLGFTMAEAEPGATEEQAEVGEEPVEVAEARISLTNVVGSVFRAHRLDIGQGLCVSVVIWTLLSDPIICEYRKKVSLPSISFPHSSQVWDLCSI